MEDWLCIFGGIQMALGFQCQPLSWLRELARRCYRGWDGASGPSPLRECPETTGPQLCLNLRLAWPSALRRPLLFLCWVLLLGSPCFLAICTWAVHANALCLFAHFVKGGG